MRKEPHKKRGDRKEFYFEVKNWPGVDVLGSGRKKK